MEDTSTTITCRDSGAVEIMGATRAIVELRMEERHTREDSIPTKCQLKATGTSLCKDLL